MKFSVNRNKTSRCTNASLCYSGVPRGPRNKPSEEELCGGHGWVWEESWLAHTSAGVGAGAGATCLSAHEHPSHRVCSGLDLDSIIPGAFALLFDLSILSLQPPSLLRPSCVPPGCLPFSRLLSHTPFITGPDSHSGRSFHLSAPGPPAALACLIPLRSLQHILPPVSASNNCSLHFP